MVDKSDTPHERMDDGEEVEENVFGLECADHDEFVNTEKNAENVCLE